MEASPAACDGKTRRSSATLTRLCLVADTATHSRPLVRTTTRRALVA